MNIEQAKRIPISEILSKIDCQPTLETKYEAWYLSPFRNEKTASFHIHKANNVWYDFGIPKGGNNIDFACEYLRTHRENDTVSDALRWIKNMTGYGPIIANVEKVSYVKPTEAIVIKDKRKLEHPALVNYLRTRGIPAKVAEELAVELRVLNNNTGKTFSTLGVRNEDAGYELRNPYFKGSTGKKTITFVRGARPKPEGINIFEGFMDYLSIIANQEGKKLEDDTIILNSLACLQKASPYINGYGYKFAYTWLDNDEAGKKAGESLAAFFKTQKELEYIPMNEMYEPYKDVNEWYVAKSKLNK